MSRPVRRCESCRQESPNRAVTVTGPGTDGRARRSKFFLCDRCAALSRGTRRAAA